jgi:hypothetical protein
MFISQNGGEVCRIILDTKILLDKICILCLTKTRSSVTINTVKFQEVAPECSPDFQRNRLFVVPGVKFRQKKANPQEPQNDQPSNPEQLSPEKTRTQNSKFATLVLFRDTRLAAHAPDDCAFLQSLGLFLCRKK